MIDILSAGKFIWVVYLEGEGEVILASFPIKFYVKLTSGSGLILLEWDLHPQHCQQVSAALRKYLLFLMSLMNQKIL